MKIYFLKIFFIILYLTKANSFDNKFSIRSHDLGTYKDYNHERSFIHHFRSDDQPNTFQRLPNDDYPDMTRGLPSKTRPQFERKLSRKPSIKVERQRTITFSQSPDVLGRETSDTDNPPRYAAHIRGSQDTDSFSFVAKPIGQSMNKTFETSSHQQNVMTKTFNVHNKPQNFFGQINTNEDINTNFPGKRPRVLLANTNQPMISVSRPEHRASVSKYCQNVFTDAICEAGKPHIKDEDPKDCNCTVAELYRHICTEGTSGGRFAPSQHQKGSEKLNKDNYCSNHKYSFKKKATEILDKYLPFAKRCRKVLDKLCPTKEKHIFSYKYKSQQLENFKNYRINQRHRSNRQRNEMKTQNKLPRNIFNNDQL